MHRSDSFPVADEALLERFETRLAELQVPVLHWLQPGLSDDEIDELLEPRQIVLPEEARAWWRWHNGVRLDAPGEQSMLLPGRTPFPLELACTSYDDSVQVEAEYWDQPVWSTNALLTPVGERPYIYFASSGPRDAPVRVFTALDPTLLPQPVLPSIGTLIHRWLELIESGAWAIDKGGLWRVDDERMDPEAVLLGIV